jgi:hypothetical protein
MIQVQKLGYRDQEPDPMERELSHTWPLVFQGLRELDGMKRKDVAEQLGWPLDELKSLVFQLVLSDRDGGRQHDQPPEPPPETRKAITLMA